MADDVEVVQQLRRMLRTGGRYDAQCERALRDSGGQVAALFVLGPRGPGFSVSAVATDEAMALMLEVPDLLEHVAKGMRAEQAEARQRAASNRGARRGDR